MAYITASDFYEYQSLGVDSDVTAIDASAISTLLTDAQAIIDAVTGRTFEYPSTDAAIHYFNPYEDVDGMRLFLDADLCSVTSITDGNTTDAIYSSDSVFITEPYNTTPYNAIVLLQSSGHYWGYDLDPEKAIEITGQWCYSATAPAAIKLAMLRLLAWLWHQREGKSDPDRPIVSPDGLLLVPSKLPADVAQILARYTRRKFGAVV